MTWEVTSKVVKIVGYINLVVFTIVPIYVIAYGIFLLLTNPQEASIIDSKFRFSKTDAENTFYVLIASYINIFCFIWFWFTRKFLINGAEEKNSKKLEVWFGDTFYHLYVYILCLVALLIVSLVFDPQIPFIKTPIICYFILIYEIVALVIVKRYINQIKETPENEDIVRDPIPEDTPENEDLIIRVPIPEETSDNEDLIIRVPSSPETSEDEET